MATALDILRSVYGHKEFRSVQPEVIDAAVNGLDVIGLMGTGAGKTVCYQIPMLLRSGLGVVISPLKALIRDQLDALEKLGLQAATINGEIVGYERQNILNAAANGEIKFLYVTPEMVAQPWFQKFLMSVRLSAFGIDEGHCASVYGNDFRPDYKLLSMLAVLFPGVPRIAVTATADPQTLEDMRDVLNMKGAATFVGELDRKNIELNIEHRMPIKKHRDRLREILEQHQGESGLIYAIGRNSVDKVADWLIEEGYSALPYHAGMDDFDRDINQDRFISGDVQILVCTVAFGMGIDKSNIRFVVHDNLSGNIESYVQETGRAGRDGAKASAYMFYANQDIALRRRMTKKSAGGAVVKRTEHAKLDLLLGLCETATCRRGVIMRYFGQEFGGNCGNCDNCRTDVKATDLSADIREIADFIQAAGRRVSSFDVVENIAKDPVRVSSMVRQMVAAGLATVDHSQYGALQMTALGRSFLESSRPFPANENFVLTSAVTLPSVKKAKPVSERKARARTEDPATGTPRRSSRYTKGSPLLEALRRERNRLAREQGVKKFRIVHDKALQQMAEDLPRSIPELLQVKGIGNDKADRFGVTFLNIIRKHAA